MLRSTFKFALGVAVVIGALWGAQPRVAGQTFPAPIAQAITLLTTGVTPFSTLGMNAGAYVNWGTSRGSSGYGFRDNSGTMQVKNSGGAWTNFTTSGSAPSDATYITQTPSSGLSAEQALSTLGSALLVNATSTGVLSAYAGATCTNQFLRALSALGAGTCAAVNLSTDVTNTLGALSGGTGFSTYAQGDILYASATNVLSKLTKSSSATRYLSNTGTSNSPAWAQVLLTDGVTGTLPFTNGGFGIATATSGGIPFFATTTSVASSGVLTASRLVLGGGAGSAPTVAASLGTTVTVLHGNAAGAPTFAAVDLSADTTGSIPPTRGGTGQTGYAVGDLLYADTTTTLAKLAASTAGKLLRAAGVSTAPAWSTTVWTNSAATGDLLYASGANTYANLNVSASSGSFLLSNGTVPGWSTLLLPNAATVGDIPIATSADTLTMLTAVAVGRVLASAGVAAAPTWSDTPFTTTFRVTSAFIASTTPAASGSIRLGNAQLVTSRDAANSADITLITATAADRVSVGSAAATGFDVVGLTKALHWQVTAPTVSSGFGTTPSIAGAASAFKVTVGSGGDTSGVVLFNATWTTAPVCMAQNQTTSQAVRPTPTTTQITLTGTLAASDVVAVVCTGY